ncbi:MaoC family dehydratase N-terminal domain-containing protein [Marmoricola sp. URHB0036]|uniref:FAS1-like dehydratase domain-containing protein n=1 Tax=Marmoricola sp. URHB0036 TaxID=1298863 RepID=UPI0003F6924D|nr:MaoC family dehydratase N-terminal domain-containing protein [Marmoricola sp. URHB0036]
MADVVERTELIGPEPAIALADLLDVPLPDLAGGEGLPLTWHWVYLLDRPRQQDLAEDGHPVRNAVLAPPRPGLRRMWAGGSVRTVAPLRVGAEATRRTAVVDTSEKDGRSGRLTFVTVGHTILQHGEVAIEERQHIVYRESAGAPSGETDEMRPLPRWEVGRDEWSIRVTPTLLFRFSALTCNAHRIHYDRDYARHHEGYPGLVVHGPLQAVAMAEAARRSGVTNSPGTLFEYRLVAPLFERQGLVARPDVEAAGVRTTVRDDWGRMTAEGRVVGRPAAT